MALSSTTRVGFAFQTAFSQETLTAASTVLPVDPPTFNLIYDVINDQTQRGDPTLDYDLYQGVKRVESSVDGPFYADEVGFFLKALMGSEIFSSGGSTGQHIFHGLSNPSAATFFITDDVTTSGAAGYGMRYFGNMCTSFGIRFNAGEGILTYTSTWTGRNKAAGVTALTMPTYSTALAPFLGWQADVVASGGSASTWQDDVLEFEITVNRAPSLLYTANNTQLASRLDIGPFEATGRLLIDYRVVDQFNDYESNSDLAATVTFTGTGANAGKSLAVNIPKFRVLDAPSEIQRGGVSLALQLSFRAMGFAAYKSPVRFTLVNARQSAYT